MLIVDVRCWKRRSCGQCHPVSVTALFNVFIETSWLMAIMTIISGPIVNSLGHN